jgi:hypothetical protein
MPQPSKTANNSPWARGLTGLRQVHQDMNLRDLVKAPLVVLVEARFQRPSSYPTQNRLLRSSRPNGTCLLLCHLLCLHAQAIAWKTGTVPAAVSDHPMDKNRFYL